MKKKGGDSMAVRNKKNGKGSTKEITKKTLADIFGNIPIIETLPASGDYNSHIVYIKQEKKDIKVFFEPEAEIEGRVVKYNSAILRITPETISWADSAAQKFTREFSDVPLDDLLGEEIGITVDINETPTGTYYNVTDIFWFEEV